MQISKKNSTNIGKLFAGTKSQTQTCNKIEKWSMQRKFACIYSVVA